MRDYDPNDPLNPARGCIIGIIISIIGIAAIAVTAYLALH